MPEVPTFHSSRLLPGELFFPRTLILGPEHVLTRKRNFPAFWIHHEESIPYGKVGSIQLARGLLWSTVVIENTGGVDPIVFRGIGNRQALVVRDLIERRTGSQPEDESRAAPRLRELKEMLDGGLISQSEYEEKRAEIIQKV